MLYACGMGELAMASKRISVTKTVRANGHGTTSQHVGREDFGDMIRLFRKHGGSIDELRRELHGTCRDLAEDIRRELGTQFTRIAQIQQEIDEIKRRLKESGD